MEFVKVGNNFIFLNISIFIKVGNNYIFLNITIFIKIDHNWEDYIQLLYNQIEKIISDSEDYLQIIYFATFFFYYIVAIYKYAILFKELFIKKVFVDFS